MLKSRRKDENIMKILIQNGHVLDPESKTEGIYDILVEEKKIVKVAEHITDAADKVIDAKGCFVMPGFIDLHVHLRDPGLEYKETLKTGGDAGQEVVSRQSVQCQTQNLLLIQKRK